MYKFTWRIENFGMLPQKTGEFISTNFEVKPLDDVNVSLHLYPNGESNSACIGYRISIDKPQTFESLTKVKIHFYQNKKSMCREQNINEVTNYHSFEKRKIEADKFQDLFLSTDIVDFECVFYELGIETTDDPVTYSEKTVVETKTYSHDFSITEILSQSALSFWNAHLLSHDFSEKFTFCLGFQTTLKKNNVEIKKLSTDSSMLSVCYKILLLDDATENKIELKCDKHTWRAGYQDLLWKTVFDIDACASKHFKTMRCEVVFSEGNIVTVDPHQEITPLKQMPIINCPTSLMKQMLQTKLFSDVIFQVGSHQLAAHKCVLGTVSEVFAAMFKTKMVEEDTNVINITDIDKDIVGKMLEFIYIGDVDVIDIENLVSLYFAAEKYQVLELKKLCSLRLTNALSADNCLEILKYADMLHDSCLKDAAHNFICDNRKEIPKSSWEAFTMQSNMELVSDILFNFSQRP